MKGINKIFNFYSDKSKNKMQAKYYFYISLMCLIGAIVGLSVCAVMKSKAQKDYDDANKANDQVKKADADKKFKSYGIGLIVSLVLAIILTITTAYSYHLYDQETIGAVSQSTKFYYF